MSRRKQTNPQPMKRLPSLTDSLQLEPEEVESSPSNESVTLNRKLLGNSSNVASSDSVRSPASKSSLGDLASDDNLLVANKLKKKKRTNSSSSSVSSASSGCSDALSSSAQSPPLLLLNPALNSLNCASNPCQSTDDQPHEQSKLIDSSAEPSHKMNESENIVDNLDDHSSDQTKLTNGSSDSHTNGNTKKRLELPTDESDEVTGKKVGVRTEPDQDEDGESDEITSEPSRKRRPPSESQSNHVLSLTSDKESDVINDQISAMQLLAKYQSQFAQLQAQLMKPTTESAEQEDDEMNDESDSTHDQAKSSKSKSNESFENGECGLSNNQSGRSVSSIHTSSTLEKLTSIVDSIDKIRVAPNANGTAKSSGGSSSLMSSPGNVDQVDLQLPTLNSLRRTLDNNLSDGSMFTNRRSVKSPSESSHSSDCASPSLRNLSRSSIGQLNRLSQSLGVRLNDGDLEMSGDHEADSESANQNAEDEEGDEDDEMGSPLDFSVRQASGNSPRRKRHCTPSGESLVPGAAPLDLSCKNKEEGNGSGNQLEQLGQLFGAQLAGITQLLAATGGLATNPLLAGQLATQLAAAAAAAQTQNLTGNLLGLGAQHPSLGASPLINQQAQLSNHLLSNAGKLGRFDLLGNSLLGSSMLSASSLGAPSPSCSSASSPAPLSLNKSSNSTLSSKTNKLDSNLLGNANSANALTGLGGLTGLGNLLQSVGMNASTANTTTANTLSSTSSNNNNSSSGSSFGKIGGLWNGMKLKSAQYSTSAQLHHPNPKQMQLRERSSNGQGRANPWQTQWMNRSSEQNRDVFTCVWCKQSFRSLQEMTEHMKVSPRCGMAGMQQAQAASAANSLSTSTSGSSVHLSNSASVSMAPVNTSVSMTASSPSASSIASIPPKKSTSLSSSASAAAILSKEKDKGTQMPRKLVRGQDVWLGRGAEQTRQILKCMWCGQSFKTLDEMTKHMQVTKHYTNIISQEQITSWKAPEDVRNSSEVNQVLTCKVCDESFATLKELSTHIVRSSHFADNRNASSLDSKSLSSSNELLNKIAASALSASSASALGNVSSSLDRNSLSGSSSAALAAAQQMNASEHSKKSASGKERRKKSLPVRKLLEMERNVPSDRLSASSNHLDASGLALTGNDLSGSNCSSPLATNNIGSSVSSNNVANNLQLTKTLMESMQKLLQATDPKFNDNTENSNKNSILAQPAGNQLLSLIMAAAAASGAGGLAALTAQLAGTSASVNSDRKSPASLSGGESGPPSTLGEEDADNKSNSDRLDSKLLNLNASSGRECKTSTPLSVMAALGKSPEEPLDEPMIESTENEPSKSSGGSSVLSALEQLIEKSFDCKSKKSSSNQGILQRLGIDEEVCPPWQAVNSSSPSNSGSANGNFYSWSP